MKRNQAIALWKEVRDNTQLDTVLVKYKHKTGWPAERTLRRYVQADEGFQKGDTSQEIARRAGWRVPYVEKIREWWEAEFGETSLEPEQNRAAGYIRSARSWPPIRIGATLEHVEKAGYYDRMFDGSTEGVGAYVRVKVVLEPSRPLRIDMLTLRLWGQHVKGAMPTNEPPYYGADPAAVIGVLTETRTCDVTFKVPKNLAVNTDRAFIHALANGLECRSAAFSIRFPSNMT